MLLAPEQHVVLETDPDKARAVARASLTIYMTLPNYVNNWRRFGFTDDDVSGTGSDRLVDALVRGVTKPRLLGACGNISMPAPTTCACRS